MTSDATVRQAEEAGARLVRFLYCDNGAIIRGKASAMAGLGGRLTDGIGKLEAALQSRPWIAGQTYSLADANGFNLGYALPLAQPAVCNDEKTPAIMEWLRKIYERPATKACWKLGRVARMSERVSFLERK